MRGSSRLDSEHYDLLDAGAGVTFCRARASGTALSNAGIVDLGPGSLVFDTGLTLRAARELRSAARTLTGEFPTLAANSHWHLDHVLGNSVFPDAPVYATVRTVEILLERRTELLAELSREALEAAVREIEGEGRQRAVSGPPSDEKERTEYAMALRIHRALLAESDELSLRLPERTFADELPLPGEARATLLSFGAGHTESDALLYVPGSRFLFAGDLVVAEAHPNLTSGDPEHWLKVLDEIDRLRPEKIGTGHGPLGSLETVASLRDYLTTVLELARGGSEPEIPARFRPWSGADQFARNIEFLRARGHTGPAGRR